jgi:rod shape-determining protein MreC
MALLDIRQRTGFLFLTLAVGHILLISAQVYTKRGVPILEAVTFGVVSEVQRGISAGVSGVRQAWSGYIALRGVRADNETLRRQLADAEVQLQQQRALADRTRGLQQLLDLQQRVSLDTAAAEIIASSATPDFQTVTIDKGTRQRLSRDMAVVAPAGIVGRVVVASPRASKVQLLIDRNAAAGALVERSRAQGVIVGAGDGRHLRMEYVSEVADVAVGDLVVTSGIDAIYPKGFVIGRVDTVEKSGGAYRRIVVRPAVDFARLEEVLVILTPSPARQASEAPQ